MGASSNHSNLVGYQLSNFTLKLREADTTLIYKSPLAAFATLVQPPPVLATPCAPDVILKVEATPDQEPICKVPELLLNLMQSPATTANSTLFAAVLLKLPLPQVEVPDVLLAALDLLLDATELLATLDFELLVAAADDLLELAAELVV